MVSESDLAAGCILLINENIKIAEEISTPLTPLGYLYCAVIISPTQFMYMFPSLLLYKELMFI